MKNDRMKVDLDRFLSKNSGFTLVEMVISLV
ncbi:prepilin-type N-terminal cleavage/methylation domain-containing protein, partial [candidate division KSB1 bacterium]|nr:prepilin-type N-terminal cleavage/methylation domain-containing protein [candidate division KSB1 bacterium]